MSSHVKQCPKCFSQNPAEANFCRHCGNVLNDGKRQLALVVPEDQIIPKLRIEISSLTNEKKRLLDKLNTAQESYQKASRKASVNRVVHFIYIFVIIVCSIGIIWLINIRKHQNEVISDLRAENASQVELLSNNKLKIQQLESNSDNLNTTLSKRNDEIKELSSVYPFIITSVDVKNQGEEYGATIYTRNTTFIYDRINIKSHFTGSVTIYVKFYRPNGELSVNSKSPIGYSYSQQIDLKKGESTYTESTGWGNTNKGFWKQGLYYMEFWYNNMCFYRKSFYISSL